MNTFPKWGYKDGESRIFDVDEAKPDLPKGWYESPADVPTKAAAKKNETKQDKGADLQSFSKEELIDVADTAGIEIDKRWSEDKIRDAVGGVVND